MKFYKWLPLRVLGPDAKRPSYVTGCSRSEGGISVFVRRFLTHRC